ncbi:hypothetical protein [Geodermatophilus sp. URMC 65]|jgi:hypothetical protein
MYGSVGVYTTSSAGGLAAIFAAGAHTLGIIVSITTLLFGTLAALKLLPRRWR